MKRSLLLIALAGMLMAGAANASPKADSIKAYTGAVRAKFVWDRIAFCDANYSPVSNATDKLMLFDTDESVERVLDGATQNYWGFHNWMRISRSGKWAMWNEGTTTMILDLTAATPTKRLLLTKANCSYWCGRAFWLDSITGIEYIFCLDNYGPWSTLVQGNGIYKVPLNADGTADVSKAEQMKISWVSGQSHYVDDVLSISDDGKKLGGAFPWPDTYILDLTTGKLDYRHEPGFGCQANLAPDNSYRFFHCQGDHLGVFMFAANMVDQHWYINMSKNLYFFGNRDSMDFSAPRWSNNVQFVANSCPMGDNFACYSPSNNPYAGHNAAWIKANVDYAMCRKFILQKFTPDFKGIESSIPIADDLRNMESGGDAWFSNGVTGKTPIYTSASNVKAKALSPIRLSYAGGFISLTMDRGGISHVKVTDSQGKLTRRWDAYGTASFNVKNLRPGTYCVAATSGEFRSNKLISTAR